jgi:acetoacetyl-CoA synthetase
MWNWLVSSLAVGATVVLYEGNPFYPSPDALLKMADELDINIFGTSAKYIASLEDAKVVPEKTANALIIEIIATTSINSTSVMPF